MVFLLMERTGNVVRAKRTCAAGKGAACSHSAALMFYLEDMKKYNRKCIPYDKTVTEHLYMWHVPSKRVVAPQPVKQIKFVKSEYGKCKLATNTKKIEFDPHHFSDRTIDKDSLQGLFSDILVACPRSGVKGISTHNYDQPINSSGDEPSNINTTPANFTESEYSCLDYLNVYQA